MWVFTNDFSSSLPACLSSFQSGITMHLSYLLYRLNVHTLEGKHSLSRLFIINELNHLGQEYVMMGCGTELGASPEEHGRGQSHWHKGSCRVSSGQWGSQGSLISISVAPRRAWHLTKASNCLDATTEQFSKKPLVYDPWHPRCYCAWLMMRGKRIQSW